MAYKFTYITVPHTGTRYLEAYFIYLGFTPLQQVQEHSLTYQKPIPNPGEIEFRWRHYIGEESDKIFPELGMAPSKFPIVSTLRHPYLSAISFINRKHSLNRCVKAWDSFIRISTQREIIFYNTDCPKDKQKSHLLNIIRKVNCYEEKYDDMTEEFIDTWPILGKWKNNIHKDRYLDNGTLPDVYDWNRFDRAVNWYNKVIEQCEY